MALPVLLLAALAGAALGAGKTALNKNQRKNAGAWIANTVTGAISGAAGGAGAGGAGAALLGGLKGGLGGLGGLGSLGQGSSAGGIPQLGGYMPGYQPMPIAPLSQSAGMPTAPVTVQQTSFDAPAPFRRRRPPRGMGLGDYMPDVYGDPYEMAV